jgi:hypothetical protein
MKYELVSRTYSKKSLTMASIFGSKSKSSTTMSTSIPNAPLIEPPEVDCMTRTAEESWEIIDELAFDNNELWEVAHVINSAVKAISSPGETTQLSEENLCELEKKVDYLMEKQKGPLSPRRATINSISNINPTPLSESPLRENAETFQK